MQTVCFGDFVSEHEYQGCSVQPEKNHAVKPQFEIVLKLPEKTAPAFQLLFPFDIYGKSIYPLITTDKIK